ncbi:hypothetical protein [Lacticaseibacillus brantae]|uniref:Uncharacterized protein n=1 Tax=Lacticaseibacillus brantae DSM 23927 TaxID=1423727 RepID=A0A0R2AYB6_9LACO|nr:hypothetical protein [Lacticaseibacillus brantae]KRM71738.1 hypothetical protein FC34_GL001397 [Lacticaseibacillus brantae DSM 23927]
MKIKGKRFAKVVAMLAMAFGLVGGISAQITTTVYAAESVPSQQVQQAQSVVATDPALTSTMLNGQRVFRLADRTTPKDFNLAAATDTIHNYLTSTTKTIAQNLAVPDPDANYEVLGGLVRRDNTGFYEFTYNKANQTGHVLYLNPAGQVIKTVPLQVGKGINIDGLVQWDLALAAVETVRGIGSLLLLDPMRLVSVGARLVSPIIEGVAFGGASQVMLNTAEGGKRAYINITNVGGNNDEFTFSRPYADFASPVPVRVVENYTTAPTIDKELYVYLDPTMSYSDLLATYNRVKADFASANASVITSIQDVETNGQVVPTVAEYTPGQWLTEGGQNNFERSYSLFNRQGGVQKVVTGNAIAQKLGMGSSYQGQSWDSLGKAGYTFQRVAELDNRGVPTRWGTNTTRWVVVPPLSIVSAGSLTYAQSPFDWQLLNWRKAESVRVTGLLKAGEESGFTFTVKYDGTIYPRD